MARSRLNVVLALTVFLLFLTITHVQAAEKAVVIPLFSAQKSVTTGTAISGKSTDGLGVFGYSENGIAIWGQDAGTTQGKGYGGYFTSNTGVGVFGRSTATPTTFNPYTPGVYGSSRYGYGVYGTSEERSGVVGKSDTWYGGYFSGAQGGVYGFTDGSHLDEAYAGYFYSANYRGIYARSSRTASFYAAYFDGRNSTSAGIYVNGTITASGSKTGYVVDIAINDGTETLETGDLVIISGYDDPIIGEIPLVRVIKCTTAESSAIVGIVDQPFSVPSPELNKGKPAAEKVLPRPASIKSIRAEGTGIASGEYLSIVTLGAYKTIKADATGSPIRPGSLLVSSDEPGHVMAADRPACGTVIGKALGSLDSGTGLIPIMVTLQ